MSADLALVRPGAARRLHGQAAGTRWDMALRPPAARLRPYIRGDYVSYTDGAAPRAAAGSSRVPSP